MFVNVDPVHDSADFPEQVDVVVIGGGILGTCAAHELAGRGVSVALLEKGLIGCEQSSRNWGWVRQQNRDLYELPLAMHSLSRWDALFGEVGSDVGFRRSGIVYTTDNQASLDKWEAWGNKARELGFTCHMMTASEAHERAPGTTSRWLGGVWTERGLIRTSSVICAGGAWSSRFCRRHGIELPSANIMGTTIQTTPAPEVTPGCLTTPKIALRRRLDGSYTLAMPGLGRLEISPQSMRYAVKFYGAYRSKLAKKLQIRIGRSFFRGPEAAGRWEFDKISPFEEQRVLDPMPDMALARATLAGLHAEYPSLKGVHLARAWAGMIDTTPDLVPVISPVDAIPGFTVAAGCSGHGFGIGPAAGQLAADLATSATPRVNSAPYHLDRFARGSRIRQPEMM